MPISSNFALLRVLSAAAASAVTALTASSAKVDLFYGRKIGAFELRVLRSCPCAPFLPAYNAKRFLWPNNKPQPAAELSVGHSHAWFLRIGRYFPRIFSSN